MKEGKREMEGSQFESERKTAKNIWGSSHRGASEEPSVPQNCLLKTCKMGGLISRSYAFVPYWSRIVLGSVNSLELPDVLRNQRGHQQWSRHHRRKCQRHTVQSG